MNLLLSALLLVQDPTPEEAFRKIEETFEKAGTVALEFKSETAHKRPEGDVTLSLAGSVLLKEGNRFKFSARARGQGMDEDFATVCDGTRILERTGKKEPVLKDAPKELVQVFQTTFVRGGIFLAFATLRQPQATKKQFEILGLRQGADLEGRKSLVFRLRFPEAELECTLHYDPKTWILSGRTMTILQNGAATGKITETYAALTLNGDLPDATFKVEAPDPKGDAAKVAATKAMIQQVSQAVDLYKLDHNQYPSRLEDLVTMPPGFNPKKWPPGGYLPKEHKDAWNRDFIYRVPGTGGNPYDVISLGEDGKEGGAGAAADLTNR